MSKINRCNFRRRESLLYIPHDLGVQAINYLLPNFPNDLQSQFPKPFIQTCVQLHTLFQKPTHSFLIQTIIINNCANIFNFCNGILQRKIYSIIEKRFGLNTKYCFMDNWQWFLVNCKILLNPKNINPNKILELFEEFLQSKSSNTIPYGSQ